MSETSLFPSLFQPLIFWLSKMVASYVWLVDRSSSFGPVPSGTTGPSTLLTKERSVTSALKHSKTLWLGTSTRAEPTETPLIKSTLLCDLFLSELLFHLEILSKFCLYLFTCTEGIVLSSRNMSVFTTFILFFSFNVFWKYML